MSARWTAALGFLALLLLTSNAWTQQENFIPRILPSVGAKARLEELSPNNMPIVKGKLGGVECNLLVDTGATHTTFDRSFLKKNFPDLELDGVLLAGETNVESIPSIAKAPELGMGEAVFAQFDIMALDLRALEESVGCAIHGIVGMNVLGATRTRISLADGEIAFSLPPEARDGFAPARRVALEDSFTMTLAIKTPRGAKELIVDSGSTWTFLDESFDWPLDGNSPQGSASSQISARDINSSSLLDMEKGAKGELEFWGGAKITLEPLISKSPLNRIGSDVLRVYDILIEPRAIGWKKSPSATKACHKSGGSRPSRL